MTVMADTRPPTAMAAHRPRLLVAVLSLVVLTVSILQTAVVPVLDVIGRQLDASEDAVSWVVTANLLAAAASTPATVLVQAHQSGVGHGCFFAAVGGACCPA